MDEAKQMTVEEALDAADQIVGFYDGDPYDLIERGCDTLEVLAAEVRRLTAALDAVTAERDALREEASTGAAAQALDAIAVACGCAEWEYPGQIVRDVSTALATARREGAEEMRGRAANACERMVVGGCAWSEEQAIAGRALLDAAGNIRALPLDAPGGAT